MKGDDVVNIKVSRETHSLILRLKGLMLSRGGWSREPLMEEVVRTAVEETLKRANGARRSGT